VTISFLEIYMENITDLFEGVLQGQAMKSARGALNRSSSPGGTSFSTSRRLMSASNISVSPVRTGKESGLVIREDPKSGIFVDGLTQIHVKSKDQLLNFIKLGMRRRQVNQTGMNRNSSRSHSILYVFLE
jgi:hypothetical protein